MKIRQLLREIPQAAKKRSSSISPARVTQSASQNWSPMKPAPSCLSLYRQPLTPMTIWTGVTRTAEFRKSITILRFKILNSHQLLFPIGKAMTPSCSAILSGGARRRGLSTALSKATTSPEKRSFRSAHLPATVSATAAASSHRWLEPAHGRMVCAFPKTMTRVPSENGQSHWILNN